MHEDDGVMATSVQSNAPWALDRIDQEYLPLDGSFAYYNTGTSVNVYIVDTVSLESGPLPHHFDCHTTLAGNDASLHIPMR